jgi:hypothetical protein
MRTTSKPHPNQALALPSEEALHKLFDEIRLTDYSGKKFISKTEIKHIHLNYLLWDMPLIDN